MHNNQIIWASRRGMLELDLLLTPFAKIAYPTASTTTKDQFINLLSEQDQDLYQWLIRSQKPPEHLKPIIDAIIAFNTTKNVEC